MWPTILIASGAAYALKLIGYVVPQRWLDTPTSRRVTALIPVALLSALIGIWTLVDGSTITIDARVPGVLAARRFRTREGAPAYVALYHLEHPAVAESPKWQAALETPWTARIDPHLKDSLHLVFARYEARHA